MSDLDGWFQEGKPVAKFEKHTYSDDDITAIDTPYDQYREDVESMRAYKYIKKNEEMWKRTGGWGTEKRVTDPDTGAMKGRKDVELFTAPPLGLTEYGKVCSYGSNGKYAPNNWRLGFAWSLSANALLRHYLAWVGGEDKDSESGLHHLAHAAWHCLVLVQYATDHPEKDDRFGGPADPATGGV